MAEPQRAAVDRLSRKEDVKKALGQAAPGQAKPTRVSRVRRYTWLGVLVALLAFFVALYVLVLNEVIVLPRGEGNFVHRLPLAAVLVVALLLAERVAQTFGIQRIENTATRYNVTRVVRLAAAVLVVVAAGTTLLGNFYTGLVSLGVVSIKIGRAHV